MEKRDLRFHTWVGEDVVLTVKHTRSDRAEVTITEYDTDGRMVRRLPVWSDDATVKKYLTARKEKP